MMKRAFAWAGGTVLLALVVASVPLERAAHQSSTASDLGALVAYAAFGGVGVVVTVRQPRNVMGWILLGIPVGLVLNTDMSAYTAIDYRIHPGRLPLGPLAVQLQPSWAPAVILLGLAILLFPDATLPSIWWRRSVVAFLALSAVWMIGAYGIATDTILLHKIVIDATGNLTSINHPTGDWAWWGVLQNVYFPVLAVSSVVAIARQVAAYRSSTGERRLQLKWAMAGATMFVIGAVLLLKPTASTSSPTWRLLSALAPIAARLREAVDLEAVRTDLLDVVGGAVEPAHASIWINHGSAS